jgi:hypothetical protein
VVEESAGAPTGYLHMGRGRSGWLKAEHIVDGRGRGGPGQDEERTMGGRRASRPQAREGGDTLL